MFYKDISGEWKFTKIPKRFNQVYAESLVKYFNFLDPLFEKAKNICEFEFILALLNISGKKAPGWDPFDTIKEIFRLINKLEKRVKDGNEQLYLYLLLYGLVIEASLPYDLIANLLNIVSGNRYTIYNFPNKKIGKNRTRPQFPFEKIEKLKELSNKINMGKVISPILEIFDKELRNAIFHSDYIIYKNEVRIPEINKIYKRSGVIDLINKSTAYFETIIKLKYMYQSFYTEPKVINVHPDFKPSNVKATVMVREGYGAIGLKMGNAHIATLLPYEKKLLEIDYSINMFPKDRIKKINNIIKFIPMKFRKIVIKYYEKKLGIS
jgi:hypothetical protein